MSELPPEDVDRPDPYALTQPLSVVRPVPAPPIAPQKKTSAEKPPYAPIFGNLVAYAFSRCSALLIDFIVIPVVFACFVFNAADRGTPAFAPRTSSGFATTTLIAFAAAIVFAILFESILETTIGKAFFGLGVRRGTGQHAGLQRIALRYILLPLDVLAIGEILALVTRRHQRLGDLAAGTVVARHRSGGFVTALAFVLFAGLIYAQATIGGGLASALAVTAEGAYFLPALAGDALVDLGLAQRPAR